jgi:DNA-directed RNA polymerase subunit RPC12/RpoP
MFDSEMNFAGDCSRALLRNGIIELKAGNREVARRYLDRALYMSSEHAVMAEAWYWMSQLADDPVEKRKALENCLAIDLQHARARRALAILDGKLKPDEIVNPEALPPAAGGAHDVDAQRFMCPKCGGRMTFSPDGQSLVCEYCLRSQRLGMGHPSPGENDFIIAMATARGHDRPLTEQVFHCQGCGAEYILPAGQLSVTCAYCGSPHVVQIERSPDLLAPDGILPHAFDQRHATDILMDWVESIKVEPERKVERPRGLYLPLWTFDFGGGIDYTAERLVDESEGYPGHGARLVRTSDQYPVMLRNVPIPASRKQSAPFVRLLSTFNLGSLQPYDPRYLADWPAELYDVSMADASLDAREQVVARLKRELPNLVAMSRLISAYSANLTIESFRLNLLPVWMTEIWFEGRCGLVLINGQNGAVPGDVVRVPARNKTGLMDWLADLVKE